VVKWEIIVSKKFIIFWLVKIPKIYIRLKRGEDCPNMLGFASAGLNQCMSGKRNNYWGKDAFIVVKGSYIYKKGTKDW